MSSSRPHHESNASLPDASDTEPEAAALDPGQPEAAALEPSHAEAAALDPGRAEAAAPEAARAPPLARPLPASLEGALELYRGPLREIRFPDLDRSRLEAQVEAIRREHELVEEARIGLERAERALEAELRGASELSERALAYARVYAQGHPELDESLAAIDRRTGAARREPGRTRGSSKASGKTRGTRRGRIAEPSAEPASPQMQLAAE
ncbi:MAG: hypothetical protein OEY14_00805 [Myxococcales bacterium]|nr:hypothetical protein [Myxococcales bacterium]